MRSASAAQPDRAFAEWERLVGAEHVLRTPERLARYRQGTTGVDVRILGALLPRDRRQIVGLVRVAQECRIPVYPISTGRNWGYSDAKPARDGCVVVDLSTMNRILDFDAELGIVTVEPGVTQQQLYRYLQSNGHPFMVPTTGAGPGCSIIGNALERGFGITPNADHFMGVNWIEGVLPDGEIYRTPLTSLGLAAVDKAFKWGVGPYLDGLFAQGSFGIVTAAAVALARRPEVVEAFYFRLPGNDALGSYVTAARTLLGELGPLVGGMNLMNARRVLSMLVPYPETTSGLLSADELTAMTRREAVPCWLGLGSLYGTKSLMPAARAMVRASLRPIDRDVRFVTRRGLVRRQRAARPLPAAVRARVTHSLARYGAHLDILEGRPSDVALRLAYWRHGVTVPRSDLDPARDGCGILWYAPLVPVKATAVRSVVDMVEKVCTRHGVEPLMTFTSLSSRCFDVTVPILFSTSCRNQVERAHLCLEHLYSEGHRIGVFPYRVGIHGMPLLVRPTPYWRMVAAVKAALDPADIMAPGRYTLQTGSCGGNPLPRAVSTSIASTPEDTP